MTTHGVGEGVYEDKWIVCYEINHRVLSDMAQNGDSSHRDGEEKSRYAYEGTYGVDARSPRVAGKFVETHIVLSVPQFVTNDKAGDEDEANSDCLWTGHTSAEPPPYTAESEKEYAHKYIVQAHPHGIVLSPQPITDERKSDD